MVKKIINLKEKPDKKLLSLVKRQNDSDAFIELSNRYENIFYKICHKFDGPLIKNGIDPNEIYKEKDYILYFCIKNFKPSKKTKFGSFLGNYARYLCLNSIAAKKFIIPSPDSNEVKNYYDIASSQSYFNNSDITQDADFISNLLGQFKDKRVVDIFNYRYFSGNKKMKWNLIAKKLHISSQTAINLHLKAITLIRNKMESSVISDKI